MILIYAELFMLTYKLEIDVLLVRACFFLLLSLGFKQRYLEQRQVFSGGKGGTSFLVWPYLSCYIVLGWIFSWAQMLLTQAYKMVLRGNAKVRCFSGCSGID